MLAILQSLLTVSAIFADLPSSTLAAPIVDIETAPIPQGGQTYCGGTQLSIDDIRVAFEDLAKEASEGQRFWLYGWKKAISHSGNGNAQFFICNNDGHKRYFTLVDDAWNEIVDTFNFCSHHQFWRMHDDKWSYGVDLDGKSECGLA